MNLEKLGDEMLSCRIIGFYPFPTPPPNGPLGWMLRDTHQAVVIQSSTHKVRRVLIDFMTKGGEFHPVWYTEAVKWKVLLGGTIQGEVRVRMLGNGATTSPQMEKLLEISRSYNCDMNLYGNNCRMFAARMEREVECLNNDARRNGEPEGRRREVDILLSTAASSETTADFRCAMRVLVAGLLPTFYPLSVLLLSFGGLHDLW